MYYHLLDGDWASNACSWQWVAAANSQKKYYANQENINKYTHTQQQQTFLDTSYEALEQLHTPDVLVPTERFDLPLKLPEQTPIHIDNKLPSFIYNYYNLDPLWHHEETGNRILLLEPAFFSKYPVSTLCIDFMLALSKNIQNIQIYIGSFETLVETYQLREIYYKEHPLNKHYTGQEETRDWIIADISGYYPSFFAYWKKMEKAIKLKYHDHR
jgi:deoxyribodipyrimidine photo-lyase